MINWAPDWVLSYEDLQSFGWANAGELMAKAMRRIYTSAEYENRGEIGELLLHIILRKFKNSEKAITRIFFKDAANHAVHGWDCVHVVPKKAKDGSSELELWIGESKLYKDAHGAAGAVFSSLKEHLETDYLHDEFAAISDKLPATWEHTPTLKALFARQTSLDKVFSRVVIPVFISYNSETTGRHAVSSAEYLEEIAVEIRTEWEDFRRRFGNQKFPREVRAQLILLPTSTKRELLESFDGRLKSFQDSTKPSRV
ncbi:DUF1837 domain-containing protein [Arthrobacter sp. PAMC25564]|uniref:HamA C-terminal domain-containing protein n=1 Tax=Arthrobacter sp. PAMC25564 TaxID=2565366 RepID=UPI0010A267EE|nr:DUF1837 domain-containing protein [Arthrobacter sp. PAMC25564]QCB98561.1 DUF1837 domain-containing protein [Arthrobacter sp. PAMC25564]